jgi:DNA-binding GntR family transcriptional regulator
METHGAVFDKYLRYQVLALTDRGDIAAREHRQLMQCALKRDAAKAGDVLKAHITGGVEHALAVGRIA